MILRHWEKYRDLGLLLLRFGLGFMMMYTHRYDILTGYVEKWKEPGIAFMPTFWGSLLTFSDFFGGLLLMLGLFSRSAAALLAFTMLAAAIRPIVAPSPEPDASFIEAASLPLELMAEFIGLIFIGPGRYSLDARFRNAGRR